MGSLCWGQRSPDKLCFHLLHLRAEIFGGGTIVISNVETLNQWNRQLIQILSFSFWTSVCPPDINRDHHFTEVKLVPNIQWNVRLSLTGWTCVLVCVFADVQMCVCIQLGSGKAHLGFYCKFLVGRQTQPVLIALGSLQWLFQRLPPDTAPLNLSSVKINCSSPPAFTRCSLRAPRGRLNHARGFESTLFLVLRPLAWCHISKHNNVFSGCRLMHLFLGQTLFKWSSSKKKKTNK